MQPKTQRQGKMVERLGLASGVCACLGWVPSLLKWQMRKKLNYMMLAVWCLGLIIKWTHRLTSFAALCLLRTLPLSGYLRAAVHGAESFITHFVHVFFRIPDSSPILALAALQKQCIQFVRTKSMPALGSQAQKAGAYHSRHFIKLQVPQ